jgi:hypothetical protein
VTALFFYYSTNQKAMAKINSGILGGFSGKISSVTGYRRKGVNIITSNGNNQNISLSESMLLRNAFKKQFSDSVMSIAATARSCYFTNPNALNPWDTRIQREIIDKWPKSTALPSFNHDLYAIKGTQPDESKIFVRQVGRVVKWSWPADNFLLSFPVNVPYRTTRRNITQGIGDVNTGTVSRNVREFQNVVPLTWAGDLVYSQVAFASSVISNPTRLVSLTGVLFRF